MVQLQHVIFHLNNEEHSVKTEDVNAETTLNMYIRDKIDLTATKRMCLEGGCGTCIVAVEETINDQKHIFAVNSCLVSIFSCHGWKIHTNEGIGGPLKGYHKAQTILADNNGSQCGFCSSGMVMNMFALMESGPKTKEQIENSFGGNICRCTGYRPILAAFKKLASDAEDPIADIEELRACHIRKCKQACKSLEESENLCFVSDKSRWIKVYTLDDLLDTIRTSSTDNYMLVGGNTARGVYRQTSFTILPNLYIDIVSVPELTHFAVDHNMLILGANISLTKTMEIFYGFSKNNPKFAYLVVMADHLDLVATVPVRNIGTLAGNLMIKYMHNEFPSDVFLLLETFNAILDIEDVNKGTVQVSPEEFLHLDMNKKIIRSISLKPLDSSYKYATFKIMPRAQNAHAMVNAGFLFQLDTKTVKSARIVYGGINPAFIHAFKTENMVKGKSIFDNDVLKQIFDTLNKELNPNMVLPDPSPQYRKGLAISLFYKFVLQIAPTNLVSNRYVSGATILQRPVSTGVQEFGTIKEKWPITKPIPKLEALAQTSGQAKYVDDIPDLPGQLFMAFVTAKASANSQILNTNTAEALKMPGVVAYFDVKDIPGENNFMPQLGGFTVKEELFCSGRVQYYDQPIGIIVANNHHVAVKAADYVKVTYSTPTTKIFLNVKDVVKDNATDRIHHQTSVVPKRKGNDIKKVIRGDFYMKGQYHFHMEVQCCQIVPTEDGIDMFPATQWMDLNQVAAAAALNIPMNKISVFVRRLGGGFGGKISRCSPLSTAAAIAAVKLGKPVKCWLPFEKNMDVLGKRYPFYVKYEIGVNNGGVIQYLNANLYSDYGVGGNENIDMFIIPMFQNCYDISTWNFSSYLVNTDTHANTWTRAPGTLESITAIESILDHIAYELNMNPFDVRLANFNKNKFPRLLDFRSDMETWANIGKRNQQIKEFNIANRWKKKGMSLVPMAWTLDVASNYSILVSIFHGDGSIVISHGGIEMGQGINTKVCQVCAYTFGVPLDKVAVKPSYNVIGPNSNTSGGSVTSEAVCYAVIKACNKLWDRIKPIKEKMVNPTWADLINKCFSSNVPLSSTGYYCEDEPGIENYYIYGLCAAEVEIDILTGQKQIIQVDIIEDVGNSMNPLIDIGQLEGAFVMGIGYQTLEDLIVDDQGKLLTDRTWTYKPPTAKDIPISFRIKFPSNIPNPVGVLQSKAIAEPPACLSVSVALAIRNALASARNEADSTASQWVPFDGPITVEKTFLGALNSFQQYKLK